MTSAINSVSSSQQQSVNPLPQVQAGKDSDGDNDGSKPGEVEKAETKPVSATVGNNVNTAA
jgi:hypothetical protein